MRHYFNPTHFLRNTAFVFLIMLASNVSAAEDSPRLSAITPGSAAPGDTTVGWTEWKSVSKSVPVTAGSGTYRIRMFFVFVCIISCLL